MSCDKALNQTKRVFFNLKERTPFDPVTQQLDSNKNPVPLTGYTFESRFLDRDPDAGEGDPVTLAEALVTIVDEPLGIFKQLLSDGDIQTDIIDVIAAQGTIDSDTRIFWEFFAILDGVRHRWLIADVGFELAGDPLP